MKLMLAVAVLAMSVYVIAPQAAASAKNEAPATMSSMGSFTEIKCTPTFCQTCSALGGTCVSIGPLQECFCIVL